MDTSKDVLTDNYAYLVKHMKAEDVLPKLVSARLVGQQMNQKIENQTDAKKVQTLLDELGRSPDPEWFVKFTDALSDTDENHKMIAKKLQAEYEEKRKQPKPVTPRVSRSRTEPVVSTGSSAVKQPVPSSSAPPPAIEAGGTTPQHDQSSTRSQGKRGHSTAIDRGLTRVTEEETREVNGQQQMTVRSPAPPPKVAPQGRKTLKQCDEGSLDTITDVSFAILLGNENEYLTILNYFGMGFRIVSEGQQYTEDVLKCTFDEDPNTANLTRLGKYYSITINGKTGIIYRSVAIGSGGRYGAMMSTISLLKKAKDLGWPLEIIFAVGCAGGRATPGQALNLGQVMVPKDVVEFNRGKVETADDGQPKFKRDPELWQTSESWYESLTDSVIHQGDSEIPSITIASGSYEYCSDFVIKDAGVAEGLRQTIADPKMIGIEMEGVGMATAIKVMKTLGNEVPEFLVVKGISDNADGSAKGAPAPMTFFETQYENVYPDDRQVMAALMSVTLVTRAIKMRREWKPCRPTWIKELWTILSASEQDAKQNKGTILKATVDYIRKMQRDMDRYRAHEIRTKQMEDSMRLLKLRIQELEVMARAHGMPTPALMPETKPLAQAAETALGSVTPRSNTPSATTPVSLLTPQRSARETPVDLTELVRNSPSIDLRASPGLDLAKLNLDDSRGLTHSPHTPRLEQIMEDESTQPSSHPMDS